MVSLSQLTENFRVATGSRTRFFSRHIWQFGIKIRALDFNILWRPMGVPGTSSLHAWSSSGAISLRTSFALDIGKLPESIPTTGISM